MRITGPVIIIDDDIDDQDIMVDVLKGLGIGNNYVVFSDCFSALQYLSSTQDKPFVILCDINLPRMNGLEFRRAIDRDEFLRKKSIPFVFLTTSANKLQVDEAYELAVQGYFTKQTSIDDMQQMLRNILNYWSECVHPNALSLK